MAVQHALRSPTRTAHAGQVRVALMCALFAGCGLVLAWRLYTFQVVVSTRYQQLADNERHAQIPIIPSRGTLLDTNGNPLAVSVRYDSVYVLGTLVGGADKADKLAPTLGPVLGMPTADVRAAIDSRSDRPVAI